MTQSADGLTTTEESLSSLASACDLAHRAHVAARDQAATAATIADQAHAALKAAISALVSAAQAKDA